MSEKQNILEESKRPPGYLGTIVEASGSQDWEKANHGITWVSASFMLINAALGAVLLNTPELYHHLGGILSATLIQIVIVLLMICTIYVLCACADLDDVDTYDEVLDYMCGRIVQKLTALSVMITCFGICVTFLVIIADQTDRVFATVWGPDFCRHWFLHRDFILILVSFLFIWPFSCARHLPNILFANITGKMNMIN